jgi:hypothetical protein
VSLPPKRTISPEEVLEGHTPEVRAIANQLRTIIKKTVEGASEAGYPGWHAIGYRHPAVGYFCGIFPAKDKVKLYFEHGSQLPDPDGLLLGKPQMQVRYLEFASEKEINAGALSRFLVDATVMKGL